MNLLLDFTWKFLFFVSIFSAFYFVAILFLPACFASLSAAKKIVGIKVSKFLLILSFVTVSLYLGISDSDLVINCFGNFAAKEGVFGITRVISLVWLAGLFLFLLKDAVIYYFAIKNLQRTVFVRKSRVVQVKVPKSIHYYEVNEGIDPMVVVFFFPKIYIPRSVSTDSKALEQILSHEYIHLQNKDNIWNFLGLLILRLNWHNPFSYFAFAAEKTNLEMATDEQAIAEFNLDIQTYAEILVKLVSHQAAPSALVTNVSGSFLQIQSRLLNLKKLQGGFFEGRSIYSWILFLFLGAGLSQALASIKPEDQDFDQAPMCFQVKHELLIENWIQAKSPETNKCE